jgi:arsenate reductase
MAEGLLRYEGGDEFEVFSAGTKPSSVRSVAIEVLREIGLDIAGLRSKSVDDFVGQPLDMAITVCNGAKETCPVFPGDVKRLHWPFEDPAEVLGSAEARKAVFRRIRDQIHRRIMLFLAGNESDPREDGHAASPLR